MNTKTYMDIQIIATLRGGFFAKGTPRVLPGRDQLMPWPSRVSGKETIGDKDPRSNLTVYSEEKIISFSKG